MKNIRLVINNQIKKEKEKFFIKVTWLKIF